jgi:hypothetical protein
MTLPPCPLLVADRQANATGGLLTVEPRSAGERAGFYLGVLASQTLATARETFAVAPGIAYATVLVLERDDARRRLSALYIGTFSRRRFTEVNWDRSSFDSSLVRELETEGALFDQDHVTSGPLPLDLTNEPELAEVVAEMCRQLGFEVAPQGDHDAPQLIIEDPSQVPVVRDNPVFLDLEAKREAAMEDYKRATDPAQQMKALELAGTLLGSQASAASEIIDEIGKLSPHDPRRLVAREWAHAWDDFSSAELDRINRAWKQAEALLEERSASLFAADPTQAPALRDNPTFSELETRRQAALRAHDASNDPAERVAALELVVDLLNSQINCAGGILDETLKLRADDPERRVAAQWGKAWSSYALAEKERYEHLGYWDFTAQILTDSGWTLRNEAYSAPNAPVPVIVAEQDGAILVAAFKSDKDPLRSGTQMVEQLRDARDAVAAHNPGRTVQRVVLFIWNEAPSHELEPFTDAEFEVWIRQTKGFERVR